MEKYSQLKTFDLLSKCDRSSNFGKILSLFEKTMAVTEEK